MSNNKYIVRIPEPCGEDWNTMKPDAKGRFCGSCNKSVVDFTAKTDTEIHNIISESKDKHICGHFRKSQIDRPLNISVPFHSLPSGLSQPGAFAIALFFVFGTILFSCTDDKGKTITKIELVNDDSRTTGAMVMPYVQPEVSEADSIVSTQYISEMMVSGGIGYNFIEQVDTLIPDTVQPAVEEQHEMYALGQMAVFTPGIVDTIAAEDTSNTVAKRNNIEPTIKQLSLSAYPNPSNGSINISYEVIKKGIVHLDIYSIEGLLVQNIVRSQEQYEGKYIIPTDLSNLPNGTYICRIMMNGEEKTTKIIVAK